MGRNTISIKQIAELAGTSVATVSRVINQNGRYSKETEEKILRIMKEHNYQPNVVAKALRGTKTNLIGVLLPDITHMFFANIFRAIEIRLNEMGYLAVLCDTNEDSEIEKKYLENLSNFRFAGLICLNGTREGLASDLTTLYVDRYPGEEIREGTHFIGCNNYQGGYLACEALIKSGKKRIALVIHDKRITTQQQRYCGFVQALNDYGYPVYPELTFAISDMTYDKGYEITEKIINSELDCDGIFYSSDILALGGLKCLNDHQISLPEQMAVVGFDDIPLSNIANLSTIRQKITEMGKLAAENIVDLIEGREVPQEQITDVELIKRGTL